MSPTNHSSTSIRNQRLFCASPRRIFTAFEHAYQLAKWWGPIGFTNSFALFEFQPGGRWVFVMHGPDGVNYNNECVFREIQPDHKIVIEHVVEPWFQLTVTLTARGNETHLDWVQEFASAEVCSKLRPICEPANEQNLDRLQSLLALKNS